MISLETPQRKWASSRLEGRTSWIFSSCGRCSRLTTGTSGTRSGGLRKGQSPCELLGGLSGFLSRRCRGLRPCVESVPEPEDSSPVLTWILGYFWSLPRGVSPRLEWGHARALSSRAVAAVSRFPLRQGDHRPQRTRQRELPSRQLHIAHPYHALHVCFLLLSSVKKPGQGMSPARVVVRSSRCRLSCPGNFRRRSRNRTSGSPGSSGHFRCRY